MLNPSSLQVPYLSIRASLYQSQHYTHTHLGSLRPYLHPVLARTARLHPSGTQLSRHGWSFQILTLCLTSCHLALSIGLKSLKTVASSVFWFSFLIQVWTDQLGCFLKWYKPWPSQEASKSSSDFLNQVVSFFKAASVTPIVWQSLFLDRTCISSWAHSDESRIYIIQILGPGIICP